METNERLIAKSRGEIERVERIGKIPQKMRKGDYEFRRRECDWKNSESLQEEIITTQMWETQKIHMA